MSKTDNPLVSIIMPVYNAEKFLRESIDSVLRQDYENFEFIIINDGSSDSSEEIIKHYSKIDKRIKLITQSNRGLVKSLNKGVSESRGSLIARIDGDDPWMEDKLSYQVDFMSNNPSVILLGGAFEVIDENGFYIETIFQPLEDEDIRRSLALRNTFGHAGVIFRKKAFIEAGEYSSNYGPTEDYDMWIRMSEIGKLANLAFPVYRYRINRHGISQSNSNEQAIQTKKHSERQWRNIEPNVIKRADLIKKAKLQLTATKVQWHGIALKQSLLEDNARIAIKMIKHGRYLDGIRQLAAVALVGRSGIAAVKKRIKQLTILRDR